MDPLASEAQTILRELSLYREWADVLNIAYGSLVLRRSGGSITYAADASEVLEYIAPDLENRPGQRGPMDLDPALSILFHSLDVKLLAPHSIELRRNIGAIRAQLARHGLANSILQELRSGILQTLSTSAPSAGAIASSLERFHQNTPALRIESLATLRVLLRNGRLTRLTRRDCPPDLPAFRPDHAFKARIAESLGRRRRKTSRNNREDARAIDYLRWLNSGPSPKVVVLVTHTPALLEIVKDEQAFPELFRDGMPCIQPPQVLTVLESWQVLRDWESISTDRLRAITWRTEQAMSWPQLRKRIEWLSEHGALLSRDDQEEMVRVLRRRLQAIRNEWEDCLNLALSRTLLQQPDTELSWALSEKGLTVGGILDKVSEELVHRDDAARGKEVEWLLSVFPPGLWSRVRVSAGDGGVVRVDALRRSRDTSGPTEYWFRSPRSQRFFGRMLRNKNKRNLDGDLQVYETEASEVDPEYYLFLSFAYSLEGSLNSWLCALGAAQRGRALAKIVSGTPPSTMAELRLAEATSLSRWAARLHDEITVEGHAGAKDATSVEIVRTSLRAAEASLVGCIGVCERPTLSENRSFASRVFRELCFVSGTLAESWPVSDALQRIDSLRRSVLFGKQALEHLSSDPPEPVYLHVVNCLLYALTCLALEGEERNEDLRELLTSKLLSGGEPLTLLMIDTVGWHYREMAKARWPSGDWTKYLSLARQQYAHIEATLAMEGNPKRDAAVRPSKQMLRHLEEVYSPEWGA